MNYSKKTNQEKKMEGTARSSDKKNNVKGNPVSSIVIPDYLDDVAKQWFVSSAEQLKESGSLSETDLTTLAFCASAYSDTISLDIELKKETDTLKKLKLLRAKNQNLKTFLDFAKTLGLTSVDRQKIKVSEDEEINPFSAFME